MKIILPILFLLVQVISNDDLGLILLNQLNIENKGIEKKFFSVKESRNDSNTSISILPIITAIDTINGQESKTIYPYLVEFNTKTKKVIRSKKINQDVSIDATGPWSIELDVGYRIKPDVWAIGVIIDRHTQSWENWGWETLLFFETIDSTFKEVFTTSINSKENYRGVGCEYHGQEVRDKITIDTTHLVNEYYSIIIESEYNRIISNSECLDTTITSNAEYTYVIIEKQFLLIDEKGIIPFVEFWDDEDKYRWFDWENKLK